MSTTQANIHHESIALTPQLTWTHFDLIESTNSYLLNSTQEPNQLISTEKQTQGRGRREQQWIDEGESALFSLSTAVETGLNISAWPVQVALTLASTLNQQLGETRIKIKWPNDLYIKQSGFWGKCAGILVESQMGKTGKVVSGIGINLSSIKCSIDSDYRIGHIDLNMEKTVLIRLLGQELFSAWEDFIAHPQVSINDYQCLDYLYKKHLVAINPVDHSQINGIGAGINADGNLLIKIHEKINVLTAQHRIRVTNE